MAARFSFDVRPAVERLCALHPGLTEQLRKLTVATLPPIAVPACGKQDILECLAALLLEPEATWHVARYCRPLLLELCHRCAGLLAVPAPVMPPPYSLMDTFVTGCVCVTGHVCHWLCVSLDMFVTGCMCH